MSKMKELSQALDELVSCGEGLIRTANALRDLLSAVPEQGTGPQKTRAEPVLYPDQTQDTDMEPVPEPDPETEPQPEPPKAAPQPAPQPEFTFTEVRKAFSAKSHAGYTDEVRALIRQYGAEKLSDVKEADYPALMADLETIP